MRTTRGLITPQRIAICHVLETSKDFPTVQQIMERARTHDPKICLSTVYRTLKVGIDLGITRRLEFNGTQGRFCVAQKVPRDHLFDTESGEVIPFQNDAFNHMKPKIAEQLGYEMQSFKVELYGVPKTLDEQHSS
ncbi:MAG: transcriptional repressor [Pseudomonadota bacterium]